MISVRLSRARAAAATAMALLLAAALSLLAGPVAAQDAEITLLHAIPGADVEVWANGEPLVTDFELGDREDLSVLAGETLTDLEVRSADSGTVIIRSESGDDQLPSTGSWTIVAHLDGGGQPKLSVFKDDDSIVPAGEGRLTIRHVAASDFIDVLVNNEAFGDGLSNTTTAEQATKPLAAGSYEVLLLDENGDLFVESFSVRLAEGESVIVYAVGSTADEPLTLQQDRTIPNEEEADPDPEPEPEPTTFVMTESDTNNAAPAAVDTGIGPLAVTRISWSRTLLVAASALLVAFGAVTVGRSRLRRRESHAS